MAKTKGASFELMAKTRECHVISVRSWSPPLFGFQDARLDRAVLGGIRAGRAGKEPSALGFLRSSEIALIADFDVGRWRCVYLVRRSLFTRLDVC